MSNGVLLRMFQRILFIVVAVVYLATFINTKDCPNGKDTCPNWSTCCLLKNSPRYGCCPYKNAQCCSDRIHCCPEGSKCNTKKRSCDSGKVSLNWMVPVYNGELVSDPERPSDVQKPDDNPCPDGNSCPKKTTCCKMPQGNYGCCPYPRANCCSDGEHCCPEKYVCDIQNRRCVQNNVGQNFVDIISPQPTEVPMFNLRTNKTSIIMTSETKKNRIQLNLGMIVCPNQVDMCPSHNTCCQMESGRFGCCPYPEAMCCSDHETCCPHGYSCVAEGCRPNLPF